MAKRLFNMELVKEQEIIVQNIDKEPDLNPNVKMEVGIDNFIQLEYEFFKSKFTLADCLLGKIYFIKINIPVRTMEIHLFRKESIGSHLNNLSENFLVGKYEILDGSPNEKEIVPIRLYLDCYELTPTFKIPDSEINVGYFIKFVIIDRSEKVYFKQQDIFLWRKSY